MVQPASVVGDDLIMKRTVHSIRREATERTALRRRVKQFYARLNNADWNGCFSLIDPQLTRQGKVDLDSYSASLRAFIDSFGSVKLWWTRLSLHLDATPNQRDNRPFAYVYVIWQDDAHGFHMFRERWIKDNGRWFTRVVGLVPNKQEMSSRRD
jgi:hypothetical protein